MGRKKKEETNDEAQERMDAEAAAVQEGSEETEETEEAEEEAEEEVEEEAEEETEEASEEAEEPARLEVTDENGALFNGDTSIRWKFDPEALVILGLDDHCDDDDPLADENAKSKLDDAQIKSVARDGVIQDVLICVRNISGVLRPVLIDSRHRTR